MQKILGSFSMEAASWENQRLSEVASSCLILAKKISSIHRFYQAAGFKYGPCYCLILHCFAGNVGITQRESWELALVCTTQSR